MPTAIRAPEHLSPQELDQYLARGWRPLGQRIYTADFIQLELGAIFSVIPTRLPLVNQHWRKGQRKLLRQNKANFEITYGPAQLTSEKKRVNDLYMLEHPTKSSADLNIHLQHEDRTIFNTQEICIYHKKKLVAFSFFDCGHHSVYSKAGIYDPAYSSFSLGIFTMYLEVEWCKENGYQHYYPGYISPDVPLFDYKTKVGPLQFWNLQTQQWEDISNLQPELHAPLVVLQHKILSLKDKLTEHHLACRSFQYIFFEMRLMYPNAATHLDQPFFLLFHCPRIQVCWVVTYDLASGRYECWETFFEQRITFFEQHQDRDWPLFKYVLQMEQLLFANESLEEIVAFVEKKMVDTEPILTPREF